MEHETPRVPFLLDFDYIEDESDEDRKDQDSSEDELDIILHGTPEQKRKLTRSLSRGSLELSSSEDEFEKEMDRELNETMRLHEKQYSSPQDQASSSGIQMGASASSSSAEASVMHHNGQQKPSLAQQFYDDIYFDSDSDSDEEGEQRKKQTKGKKQKSKHRVMTDDELLYDPNIDDENQRWVDKQRQKYRNQQTRKPPPKKPGATSGSDGDTASDTLNSADNSAPSSSVPNKQPKSDAILNCPACLTTLCLDCQRHELYHNQYRAMFVLNCTIIRSERLKYPVLNKGKHWKKNRGKRKRDEAGEGSGGLGNDREEESDELYYPVKCSVCNTEVAVYDEDEVFHFFNVLTSTA